MKLNSFCDDGILVLNTKQLHILKQPPPKKEQNLPPIAKQQNLNLLLSSWIAHLDTYG
jgi:hypothetical protein